jgi:ferritin-like metal-binding protein YciE
MKMKTLEDLFVDQLKDLYNAEGQLITALPKMAKAAASEELRTALEEHLEETRVQQQRLERVFETLGKPAKGKTCKAMQGLVEEGKEVLEEDMSPAVKDAAIIAACQRIEHYEIAGYGCVRTYATLLGYEEAAALLDETLQEEGMADKNLNALAESVINEEAAEGDMEEEEEGAMGSAGRGSAARKGGSHRSSTGGRTQESGSRSNSKTSTASKAGSASRSTARK